MAKRTGGASVRASCALQELKEGWPGTLVMAGACESPWWEGLGVGQEPPVLPHSPILVLGRER